MKKTSFWLALLLIVLLSQSCAVAQQGTSFFDPEHQRVVTLEAKDLKARVATTPPEPLTGGTRSIEIAAGGDTWLVPLPGTFFQVNAIVKGPSDKLIIVGMSGGYVYDVAVLSIARRTVEDSFTCFYPAVSPDGKYVAFTKFYGPHSSPSPSDYAMLYIIERSRVGNRAPGVPQNDAYNAGYGMYPPHIANAEADNSNVPPDEVNHVRGGYIWNGGEEYLFADTDRKGARLVLVSIKGTLATIGELAVPNARPVKDIQLDSNEHLERAKFQDGNIAITLQQGDRMREPIVKISDFATTATIDLSQRP